MYSRTSRRTKRAFGCAEKSEERKPEAPSVWGVGSSRLRKPSAGDVIRGREGT